MEIAIIGGGAAGFFGAISCATHFPDASITLYEKSTKLLSKVRVSAGQTHLKNPQYFFPEFCSKSGHIPSLSF